MYKEVTAFRKWLAEGGNSWFLYHTGLLMQDRVKFTKVPGIDYPLLINQEPIATLAKVVWDAYEKGQVHLVQVKIEPSRYDYVAVRAS